LEKELESYSLATTDITNVTDKCSSHIRRSIMDMKYTTPWPIYRLHVVSDNFPVPESLVIFFTGVLLGNCAAANPSTKIKTLINSISQDLIYATSVAKANLLNTFCCRMVKTLTENVEFIQMLNRLGHVVFYPQLEKNDTALCPQKMAANLNQKVVLPGTIQPNVFPNLAWDNITGEGTTHCVKGIAV